MADPAVEAAYRVVPERGKHSDRLMITAAREALKPIRELHHRTMFGHCSQACIDHHGNTQTWPCDTAKLIYTTEELEP